MKWQSDELHGIAQLSPLMSSFVTTLQGKCRRVESRTRKNISLFFPLSLINRYYASSLETSDSSDALLAKLFSHPPGD